MNENMTFDEYKEKLLDILSDGNEPDELDEMAINNLLFHLERAKLIDIDKNEKL